MVTNAPGETAIETVGSPSLVFRYAFDNKTTRDKFNGYQATVAEQ